MRHTQTLIAISGSDVYPKAPHLIVFFTRLIKLFGFFFSHYGRTVSYILWLGLLASELELIFSAAFQGCLAL